jgi:hypothetical protein
MANRTPIKIRRQALKLFGQGYAATNIAKQLGVNAQSIRIWAREAGIEKGSIAEKEIIDLSDTNTAAIEINLPNAKNLPLISAVNRQREKQQLQQAIDAAPSPAEQFQTLVASKGIKLLSEAFEAPPRPKNIRDLKTLSDMVGEALGISKKGGTGNRLAIDLTVLTKPTNQLTIDVEDNGG